MNKAVRHHTLRIRAANPNMPMLDCYWSARRHVHFVATLKQDLKDHKRRSKAAKKGWKARKAKCHRPSARRPV